MHFITLFTKGKESEKYLRHINKNDQQKKSIKLQDMKKNLNKHKSVISPGGEEPK